MSDVNEPDDNPRRDEPNQSQVHKYAGAKWGDPNQPWARKHDRDDPYGSHQAFNGKVEITSINITFGNAVSLVFTFLFAQLAVLAVVGVVLGTLWFLAVGALDKALIE